MSRKILALSFAALVPLMQACGSGGSAEAPDGGGKNTLSSCQFTLSGALSGTYACNMAPVATWDEASNITDLAFSSDGTPQKGSVGIAITHSFTGALSTATYAGTDPNRFAYAVDITHNATQKSWSAGSENTPGNTGGSYSVTISALEPKNQAAGAHSYDIHGTLHAKALADANSGATGEVTVDGVF